MSKAFFYPAGNGPLFLCLFRQPVFNKPVIINAIVCLNSFLCSLGNFNSRLCESVARFVLKNKLILPVILAGITAFMGWQASKAALSHGFTEAIPTDNPRYVSYQNFCKQFGAAVIS